MALIDTFKNHDKSCALLGPELLVKGGVAVGWAKQSVPTNFNPFKPTSPWARCALPTLQLGFVACHEFRNSQ